MVEPKDAYVALDRQGHPALFVPVDGHERGPSQRAHGVSLRSNLRCDLQVAGRESVSGEFNVLQCDSRDPATVDTFVLLLEALLDRLRSGPAPGDYLTTFFRTLARLLSVEPAPEPSKERQGLWGELLVIRLLGGARSWGPFWHTGPYKRFDFSSAHRRIEVKTTAGDDRTHSFSHRQLFTTGNEQVAIASLLLRNDQGGLSLRRLIEEHRRELFNDPVQLAKLEAAVRSARMSNDEEGPYFDPTDAANSLAWYWARDALHFPQPEPQGVSEVRYKVDLSATPTISGPELASWLDRWR